MCCSSPDPSEGRTQIAGRTGGTTQSIVLVLNGGTDCILYVLALENSPQNCVASSPPSHLCCVRAEWNLVMVSAWHLDL